MFHCSGEGCHILSKGLREEGAWARCTRLFVCFDAGLGFRVRYPEPPIVMS